MRVMGLDIGEKRIGVAVADTSSGIATPVCVIDAHDVLANARNWRMLLEDHEPELLVCGLPKSLSGAKGPQAQRVHDAACGISEASGIALEFADERLSSAEAKRYLREQGLSEREMRGKVDSVAASLVLEMWLSARAGTDMEEL